VIRICYNAPVIVLGADADIATTTTSGAMTTTTGTSGMRPGVTKAPVDYYGFFFAAYGVVWVAVLLYACWLASRVRALDAKN
jgi:CcmD family protein